MSVQAYKDILEPSLLHFPILQHANNTSVMRINTLVVRFRLVYIWPPFTRPFAGVTFPSTVATRPTDRPDPFVLPHNDLCLVSASSFRLKSFRSSLDFVAAMFLPHIADDRLRLNWCKKKMKKTCKKIKNIKLNWTQHADAAHTPRHRLDLAWLGLRSQVSVSVSGPSTQGPKPKDQTQTQSQRLCSQSVVWQSWVVVLVHKKWKWLKDKYFLYATTVRAMAICPGHKLQLILNSWDTLTWQQLRKSGKKNEYKHI